MKIDHERDRQVLLGLIQNSTIQGSTVLIVADLVQRIQSAEVQVDEQEELDESDRSDATEKVG